VAETTDTAESAAVAALRARWPAAIRDVAQNRGQFRVTVERGAIVEILTFLRDDPSLKFEFLADITALDHYGKEPRFRTVYTLRSFQLRQELVLKCEVPEEDCWVPTTAGVFACANWLEREVFDMFGIQFKGHPDLRRILMPDVFTDFPLRKDFPLQGKMTDQEWAAWIIRQASRAEAGE
jgi:NADH-quinone oxidoreductase subunit C